MRFLLIDPIDFAYGPRTPFERPLGGMQSSIVYIAKAISEAGHPVVVLNNIEAPETDGNVMFVPLPQDGDAFIALCRRIAPDVGIVLGGSEALFAAKHNLPDIPWMFWTGHAHDQNHHSSLSDTEKLSSDFRYMFVSEWQQAQFIDRFDLPEENCIVIGHGIAPPFEKLLDQPVAWEDQIHLTYSSTPFRGLSILSDLLESPVGARMRATIYSGMQTYNRDNSGFESLFERLKAMQHVSVPGAVSQVELAQGLSRGSVWAYSNTFAETFCIAAREAVAAGNLVITTALGALPETIGPLAYALVEPDKDPNRLRERFARELHQLEEQWRNNREPLIAHAENQKRWLKRNGTWAVQAQKLIRYTSTWLRALKRQAGS